MKKNRKNTLSSLLIILLTGFLIPLNSQNLWADQTSPKYSDYQESQITNRRFKHRDLVPLISQLANHEQIHVSEAGKSVEGREIFLIQAGSGPLKVLLWSQMHGDESTATMAIFDFLNFLKANDQFNSIRESIFREMTLYFIPMLNPDGAERFTRRNAYQIDINRDALRLQSPESRILKQVRDSLNPQFGFNLHDQNRYTSSGVSKETATFSFLAPAYNWEKEVNEQRADAMQLIAVFNQYLQKKIPGKVGRYDDTFEPRAFGDNIQKWGTSTILIECGGYPGDREKQEIRSLHFDLFLIMVQSLINNSYKKLAIKQYFQIPFNRRYLYDLIIRNIHCRTDYGEVLLDLAFNHNERQNDSANDFTISGYLADLGDLSTHFGYAEFDATGYMAIPAKVYPEPIVQLKQMKSVNEKHLLNQGYLYVQVASPVLGGAFKQLKSISLGSNRYNAFRMGSNPDLILLKEGEAKFMISNGEVKKIEE